MATQYRLLITARMPGMPRDGVALAELTLYNRSKQPYWWLTTHVGLDEKGDRARFPYTNGNGAIFPAAAQHAKKYLAKVLGCKIDDMRITNTPEWRAEG